MILYAMTMAHASTVQLLRNFNIIMCAFLTLFYLKRQLRIFHWMGVFVIFVGLCLTAFASFSNPDEEDFTQTESILGVVLTLVGTSFSSFQLIIEERLMRRYTASPFAAVGWMGIFGIVIGLAAQMLAQCTHLENFWSSWYQLSIDSNLIWGSVGFVISVAFFNASSLCITKLASSLLLAILMSSRGVLVWAAELCLGWNVFDWCSFCGMVLLTAGFFVYNHMVPRSWCGPYDRWADRELRCCVVMEDSSDESSSFDDDESVDESDQKMKQLREYGSQITSDSDFTTQNGREPTVDDKQSGESEYSWIYVEKEEWIDDK